jgi:hypothetical protein
MLERGELVLKHEKRLIVLRGFAFWPAKNKDNKHRDQYDDNN